MSKRRFFHLHLVSDATGETLVSVARAAAAQYVSINAIEHIHSLIRTRAQVEDVARGIEDAPGIVLYTLVDRETASALESECRRIGVPAVSVLDPVLTAFQSYLGTQSTGRIGAQHVLDADYFRRIDALNFTLTHDDGALPDDINEADVVIVGVSRTSKTPTSIYLANRGVKTTNMPLVPGVEIPPQIAQATMPLVIGLIASPDRIVQIRQHRVLAMNADERIDAYTDRTAVTEELALSRKLCARHGWPVIDVTRRSIEETAAAILTLLAQRKSAQT
ncbi:MAG: pyruvate, water dikinase regulatory protein [Alphaproteobacteria bacterium]